MAAETTLSSRVPLGVVVVGGNKLESSKAEFEVRRCVGMCGSDNVKFNM
jgi:hypothetical protein